VGVVDGVVLPLGDVEGEGLPVVVVG